MKTKQPDIVLIMTDQLRGDCLSIAGHPDVKTPYLDSLAARGTLFGNAYSALPSYIPARAALHTGLSQEKHGRIDYQDLAPFCYPHTMAGEISKAGYYTQCVDKMHVHPLHSMEFHNVELHDDYLHSLPPAEYSLAGTARLLRLHHPSGSPNWQIDSEAYGTAADGQLHSPVHLRSRRIALRPSSVLQIAAL